MAVSQKSSHQKAVSVVGDQSAVIRWGADIDLVVGKLHHTLLLSTHRGPTR